MASSEYLGGFFTYNSLKNERNLKDAPSQVK